jgi:hypothetical protein
MKTKSKSNPNMRQTTIESVYRHLIKKYRNKGIPTEILENRLYQLLTKRD